jgi:5-methyltetrahydrofolate--homocysteine methyltransferase
MGRLATHPVTLLDAAIGTAVRDPARGVSIPEQVLARDPAVIAALHRAHADAGAQIIHTATLNLTVPRLAAYQLGNAQGELATRAVAAARSAGGGVRVAGAVGPTGLVGKASRPEEGVLREAFDAAFSALARAGVDWLWSETHYDLAEARIALERMRALGLPCAITLALMCDGAGNYLTVAGEDGIACLGALANAGADAVGVNCVAAEASLAAWVKRATRAIPTPFIVKPNAGAPGAYLGGSPFAAYVSACAEAGAAYVGGCCGTGAAHLSAIARAFARDR